MDSVPFIDLQRFEDGFLDAVRRRVDQILQKTEFVGGVSVNAIERSLVDYTGAKHCIGCANGTDALQLVLRAQGVGRGDKVLLADFNFWAAFEAVVNVGATPITLDVEESTFHVSLATIQKAYEAHKPKAMILVHLFGWAAPETEAIRQFSKNNSLILVEDAAQAFATRYKQLPVISSAEVSTLSFYPAKVFGASGDGGAVFTRDSGLAAKIRSLANHGRSHHYEYGDVGWNSRLGSFQASYLLSSLEFVDRRIRSRRQAIHFYREKLEALPVEAQAPADDVYENGYLSLCRVPDGRRDELQGFLKERGVGTGVVYPGALSKQKGAQPYIGGSVGGETTTLLCDEVISLPCFPYITEEELHYVVSVIKSFYS